LSEVRFLNVVPLLVRLNHRRINISSFFRWNVHCSRAFSWISLRKYR